MRTRLLPVLALALASTVGCSSTPPSVVSTQPQADAQRQIAQADDDAQADDGQGTQALADAESKMPAPLSVQALPQRLDPSQVVELPADKMKEFPTQALDSDDRSTQQWRGRGFRGFGGWRGRGLRYYSYGSYYYPYFLSGSYYYPYAYYPYTYAYYPYSYYGYNYYPYYSPYYAYSSFYYPYSYGFYGRYGRYGYGRFGYGRGFARGYGRGRGR